MFSNIHSSSVYSNPQMRTIEIPIRSRLHKSIVVCAYNGIFYNNENEQTRAKYNKLDVSYKHDVA